MIILHLCVCEKHYDSWRKKAQNILWEAAYYLQCNHQLLTDLFGFLYLEERGFSLPRWTALSVLRTDNGKQLN